MSPVYETVAGIDIHKKMLAVVVGSASREETGWPKEQFGSTKKELARLREWLREHGVTAVVMESTAQYWRGVWLMLEGDFPLHLAQAQSNRARHGRKTDLGDAERLVRRFLADELVLSYVPDAEQRGWRLLARARTQLTRQMVDIYNQVENVLEQAQIKLSSVVSDVFGVSGRRMLDALVEGERDPLTLAGLGSVRLRATQEQLQEALDGSLTEEQRMVLRQILERADLLTKQRVEVEQELGRCLSAHREAVMRLCEVPGIAPAGAHELLAEIGPRAESFPSHRQLSSWIGSCPGRNESAGESSSNASPKGNRQLRRVLCQMAWAAVRSKGTRFENLFRRLVPRLGPQKAIWAIANRLVRVIWKILHEGVSYIELGPKILDPLQRAKRAKRLIRELRTMGYDLPPNLQPSSSTV